jgi:hypothetical protein
MNITNNIMNEFTIEKDGKMYDKCVVCSGITAYTTDTDIYHRVGYIEGAGQVCYNCYTQQSSKLQDALHIIKDNPNDMELGKKIREFYIEHI